MKLNSNIFKLIMIYSLVLLTTVIFIPIGKTGADSSNSEIKIDTLPEKVVFNVDNFKPGDWATRILTIKNSGNTDFTYNMKTHMKSGSELLYNQFLLKIEDKSNVIFEGNLREFQGLKSRSLASFSEEQLKLTVEFPQESGNEFQGLQTEVELVLFAEGKTDPTDDGGTPGDTGNNPSDNNSTPSNGNQSGNPPTQNTGSLPQTGEENPMIIIVTGLFISMAGLGLLLVKKSILPNPFKRG